jgi:hypothetical protein
MLGKEEWVMGRHGSVLSDRQQGMREKSGGQADKNPGHDFQWTVPHQIPKSRVVADLPFQGRELLLKGPLK